MKDWARHITAPFSASSFVTCVGARESALLTVKARRMTTIMTGTVLYRLIMELDA
ncbi:MAG: hypothetical protein OK438_01415 [Thaumarchaeota archaeon]|nr:hypothetical protein [Nitrososphaerota archaeon]